MRAVIINGYGPRDGLTVSEDIPVPAPAANQVQVRVHAAGVNPLDYRIRNGEVRAFISARFPLILGNDGAGVVSAVGSEVTRFSPGDRVFGMFDAAAKPSVRGFAYPGSYAEYAVTREDTLASIPDGMTFTEAASVPLAALTAYQALTEKAGLASGQSILINGASGGVGMFAVQIARTLGATVTAVCGPDNIAATRQFGAHEVVSYRDTSLQELRQKFDVIYDVVANQSYKACRALLGANGVYLSNVATPATLLSTALNKVLSPYGSKQRNLHAWVKSSAVDLQVIAEMFVYKQLSTSIQQVFPLADVERAHELIEAGHVTGKLVLEVLPETSVST